MKDITTISRGCTKFPKTIGTILMSCGGFIGIVGIGSIVNGLLINPLAPNNTRASAYDLGIQRTGAIFGGIALIALSAIPTTIGIIMIVRHRNFEHYKWNIRIIQNGS